MPSHCSCYLTILTLLISRLFGIMKTYLQSPSATNKETNFCSPLSPPNKTHRLPLPIPSLPVHNLPPKMSPSQFPKKQISGRGEAGGGGGGGRKGVWSGCSASNLCDTSQPPAFLPLTLHTYTHIHTLHPSTFHYVEPAHSQEFAVYPRLWQQHVSASGFLSVHSNNTWSRLPCKHEEQGVRVHNTDCASRWQMYWVKTSLARWAETTLSHPI